MARSKRRPVAKSSKAKSKAKVKPKPKTKHKLKAKPKTKPKAKAKAKAKTKPKAKAKAKKPAVKRAAAIDVFVTLNEPVQPIARGERYEDPLFEALEKAGLGGAGDGGGTLCGAEGEPEEADFDVSIKSLEAVPMIRGLLEQLGAPKGSVVRYEHGGKSVEVPVGITEGVAIYLDGITLPAEVYSSTSARELLDKLVDALGDDADFRGSWQGPRETALYMYGLDAEQLFAKMEPVLRSYPLSRNARVVVRHLDKDGKAREIRLAAN